MAPPKSRSGCRPYSPYPVGRSSTGFGSVGSAQKRNRQSICEDEACSTAAHGRPARASSAGRASAAAIEPGDGWRWGSSVVRIYGSSGGRSDGAQIVRRGFTRLSISNNVERDLLSLIEPTHPGAFDGADVHEDILAAVIRLDEPEAFLDIEPLHGSLRHLALLSVTCVVRPRVSAAGWFEFWRKVVSPTRGCAARPSRSAEARSEQCGVLWCRSQGTRSNILGGGLLAGFGLGSLTAARGASRRGQGPESRER
jgi:hypothetical protein